MGQRVLHFLLSPVWDKFEQNALWSLPVWARITHTAKGLSSLNARDKSLRSRWVSTAQPFQPQHLEVLPSIHFFSERFWGGEGVSTQTPHRQHRLCWRKSKRREQNACSGTCNTDPVFHPSSDPVQDMSAFNSCSSLSRQAVEAAPGEFAFWKDLFRRILPPQLSLTSPIPDCIT